MNTSTKHLNRKEKTLSKEEENTREREGERIIWSQRGRTWWDRKKENIHVENEDNRRTSRIEGEEDEEIKEGEGGGKGGRKSY